MTQVKLASGWPPAPHFHFSKILSPAHFDLSHDSPLKLIFFLKSISVVSFLSYSQVGFHCIGVHVHAHGMRNSQSFAQLIAGGVISL